MSQFIEGVRGGGACYNTTSNHIYQRVRAIGRRREKRLAKPESGNQQNVTHVDVKNKITIVRKDETQWIPTDRHKMEHSLEAKLILSDSDSLIRISFRMPLASAAALPPGGQPWRSRRDTTFSAPVRQPLVLTVYITTTEVN